MKQAIAAVLALMLLLSGFARAQNADPENAIVLPEPEAVPAEPIIGDYAEPIVREVTLYYPADDGATLTTLTRAISAERGDQLIEAVLRELLEASYRRSPIRNWSPDLYLIDAEFACGTVTVNLSLDAAVRQSDFSYLLLCRSIAETLLHMEGIHAVNILTADRSEMLCSLPAGVFTASSENPNADYLQLQSESERFHEGVTAVHRNALLYFPARSGSYLLPEVRSLSLSAGEDIVIALLKTLPGGSAQPDCCSSAVPANLPLTHSVPVIRTDDSGRRVIELDLTSTLINYLALVGSEPWQLYASITLSACSFVPEIDGLCLYVDGNPVSECLIGKEVLHFADGLLRRQDFEHLIGSCAPLYFANDAGGLTRQSGAISRSGANSARRILAGMIAAEPPAEGGLRPVFPEGILPSDILGVSVENGVAKVNLSAGFYAACQVLDAEAERLLIYAMVNALCELDQVGSVRFFVEGSAVESLSRDIYLKSALMPNPGIVSK